MAEFGHDHLLASLCLDKPKCASGLCACFNVSWGTQMCHSIDHMGGRPLGTELPRARAIESRYGTGSVRSAPREREKHFTSMFQALMDLSDEAHSYEKESNGS